MADSEYPSDSRVGDAVGWDSVGAAGPHTVEAFALLGNETRLAILLALWAEREPLDEGLDGGRTNDGTSTGETSADGTFTGELTPDEPDTRDPNDDGVPFSAIQARVPTDDPGNLRYHLEQLTGQFVRQDGPRTGYELRESGLVLVRAVIAGAGVQDLRRPPTEIDQPCPKCDAPTSVAYRDGVVLHACTRCPGTTPEQTETEGLLSAVPFHPAGVADRDAADLLAAASVAALREQRSMFDGLCPACSGPVDGSLVVCASHETGGDGEVGSGGTTHCSACGTTEPAWARFRCTVCANHCVTTPKALALFHPAGVGLYDRHGVSVRLRADDHARLQRVLDLLDDHTLTVDSHDPPRVVVEVTPPADGTGHDVSDTTTGGEHPCGSVSLTVDRTADIVSIERHGSQ